MLDSTRDVGQTRLDPRSSRRGCRSRASRPVGSQRHRARCHWPDMLTRGAGGAIGFTLKLPLPRTPLIAWVLCAREIVA